MKHWIPYLSWTAMSRLSAFVAVMLVAPAAFCLSIVALPVPSDLDSPELRRFLDIRNEADFRRYALTILTREASRMRRADTFHRFRVDESAIASAQASVLTAEDEALVLLVLERELSASQPDWEYIEWALIATRYGVVQDDRFVDHVRDIFRYPRGEEILDSHRASLREATELLRQMDAPAAASLWEEVQALGFGRERDMDRPVSRLARLDPDGQRSTARENAAPSRPPEGDGSERERLTAYREACEVQVDAVAATLLARFLNGEVAPEHIRFIVEHELETARVHAADEHALAFASAILIRESAASNPDWALIDDSLRICFHSDRLPGDLLPALAAILEHLHDDLESDRHRDILSVTLGVIGRVGNAEAMSLLITATTREFWERTPPALVVERSRMMDMHYAIESLRAQALGAIGFAPLQLAAPLLGLVLEYQRPQDHAIGLPPEFRLIAYRTACNAWHLAHSREGEQVEPCFPWLRPSYADGG